MVHWTFEGTHLGPIVPIPETGRKVSMSGIDVFRIANGKN
jgi:predicted ester cyclase